MEWFSSRDIGSNLYDEILLLILEDLGDLKKNISSRWTLKN